MPDTANAAQVEYWNAVAGRTWVAFQQQLDRQIEPLGAEAMRALAPAKGERILDIGCGCGQTTIELAARVGVSGAVVGVDISEPMLEIARARAIAPAAATPKFRQVDAQTEDLGLGGFDAVFSRFGVMFFADPTAAFVNIRRSLKPGGRISFVCWRPFQENLWMRAPMEAATPFLPPSPPVDPTAPGPFAFADASRLRKIMEGAGFSAVAIDPFDAQIGGSDIDQTVALTFRVGPLGAAVREHPDCADVIAKAVREAVAPFATPNGVLMPAAVWIVSGRNP
jgi:SAM-dependent methyltransferase